MIKFFTNLLYVLKMKFSKKYKRSQSDWNRNSNKFYDDEKFYDDDDDNIGI